MQNEELDKILASVEKQIGDFRRKLRNSKGSESDTTIIQQIASLFEKLVEAISGEDADLEEKRRIYGSSGFKGISKSNEKDKLII